MRLLWTVTQRKATLCSSRYTHINNTHMLTHTHTCVSTSVSTDGHRNTHRSKLQRSRLSDYVSVTLNTAWTLYTRHITTQEHTLTCTLSFQHGYVYLSLCPDGKCDCYTNKLNSSEQTSLSVCGEETQFGEYQYVQCFNKHTHTNLYSYLYGAFILTSIYLYSLTHTLTLTLISFCLSLTSIYSLPINLSLHPKKLIFKLWDPRFCPQKDCHHERKFRFRTPHT